MASFVVVPRHGTRRPRLAQFSVVLVSWIALGCSTGSAGTDAPLSDAIREDAGPIDVGPVSCGTDVVCPEERTPEPRASAR